MQSTITLEIDRKITRLSSVWVHLKRECRLRPAPFRVTIPPSYIRTIFDPYNTKPEITSWSEFIKEQIESLGTFILEGYFKAMTLVVGDEKAKYEWVIVKMDQIEENTEGIELMGQAEPFEPAAY